MKDSLKTIIFATVLGVVCAGLLASANQVLKPYQKANEEAEKWRNVFNVLGVPYNEDAPSAELLKLVRSKDPNGVVGEMEAAGMKIYTYVSPEAGKVYAVEFSGPGLWGPVEGLICLKSDLKTVYNIAFYKQEETPGLGGEIGTTAFTDRFKGKVVADAQPYLRVVKPDVTPGPNSVDGISGATLTCDKVQEMINKICEKIIANRQAILSAVEQPTEPRKEAGNE